MRDIMGQKRAGGGDRKRRRGLLVWPNMEHLVDYSTVMPRDSTLGVSGNVLHKSRAE